MRKAIKIGIITLCVVVVSVVTSLFFMLDLAFLFISNKEGYLTNYELEGQATILGITTDIDLKVDGNKVEAEFGSLEFYVEADGNTKYIYSKSIFGGWTKTTLKTENDKTAFVDLIGQIERDDFVFKSIGYYEMTPEKLQERNLEFMSLKFTTDGLLMNFRYSENLYYTILLTEFGNTKVNLPK